MNPLRKLLVIRLSALGDICMTLPVIESACRAYPNVKFTLLTSKVGAIIANSVLQQPNFETITFNKKDYSGVSGLNKLFSELKSHDFDAVADLHDVLRTKWLDLRFRLSCCRVEQIEKGRAEKKALVAHAIQRQLMTGVERYREVFERLGMRFDIDYDAAALARKLLAEASADDELAIGIAPFAQHQGKIYPPTLMRQAIDILLSKVPSLKIYLFGSRDERSVLDVWASAHPQQIINMAGAQSIDADLQLMARLKLIVSMDSANMHLASLVGLRCLSVWGATHRFAGFLGYGQREEDCIEQPLSCRPCSIYGNKPCRMGDYPCLKGLRPETVACRIVNALNEL